MPPASDRRMPSSPARRTGHRCQRDVDMPTARSAATAPARRRTARRRAPQTLGMGATFDKAHEAQQLVGMPARGVCGYAGGRRWRRCSRRRQVDGRDRARNDACRSGPGAQPCRRARPVERMRVASGRGAAAHPSKSGPPLSQAARPHGDPASARRPGAASKRWGGRLAGHERVPRRMRACSVAGADRQRRIPAIATCCSPACGGRDQPSATGVTSRRPRPIGCTAPAASASAGEES